jgi:hypothetical protein
MPSNTKRWRLVATTLVSIMFLAALIVFQGVAAQAESEPLPLNPPFVFHAEEKASAAGFVPLPPGATTIFSDTFVGFSPSPNITGTTAAWRVYNDAGAANYEWDRVTSLDSSTYANTVWAALGGVGNLDPDTNDYVPGMGTWLIYGPVDLNKYYAADLTFRYLLDASATADITGTFDFLGVGVSDDGTNFGNGYLATGDLSSAGWLTGTLDLSNYTGKSSVYVGFYFYSNKDANVGRGAFIDNVVLRAAPYRIVYMPIVAKNYSIATPTPTQAPFLYNFTFDSGQGENDPNFKQWGGSYPVGDPRIYEQGMASGNPGSGMYLYNTQTSLTTMAGPDLATGSANYEISAQFRVNWAKTDARYGIVFGADTATFGKRNNGQPTFDPNTTYYKLGLMFGSVPQSYSGGPIAPNRYRLDRCNGSESNCTKLIDNAALPASVASGNWDTLTVQRQGSTITVILNGTTLTALTDGGNGSKEFGAFIQSASNNNLSHPLEIYWDNYRVTPLP